MLTSQVSNTKPAQLAVATLFWSAVGILLLLALLFAGWYSWYVLSPSSQRNLRLLEPILPAAILDPTIDERIKVVAGTEEVAAFASAKVHQTFRAVLLDDAFGTVMYALCGSDETEYVVSASVNGSGQLVVQEINRVARGVYGASCD